MTKAQTMNTGHEGNWYDGLLTGVTGGAVLAFLMGCLKLAEKLVPWLIKTHQVKDVIAGITDQSPVYLLMEKAIAEDGAKRVLMWSGHNGGHTPSVFSPFYVSATHVAADTIAHRQRANSYHNVRVDSAYIRMLEQMCKDGYFYFKLADHPGTMLREFYESEGVTDSLLCYLGVWNNSLVYMSFATFDGLFTPQQIVRLRLRAGMIQRELKQAEK